jgi:Fe-S-cluster-containing dehydrogenase component
MRGFLLDLNRCTGCHACLFACSIENGLDFGKSWREIYTFNTRHRSGVARFHLSLGCLHCAEPACIKSCPASAYSRDALTGAVLVDSGLCIGCRYCKWACPFDAPKYDFDAGTVSKCTLCNDRLGDGKDPACASLCPTGALQFAEMEPGNGVEAALGFPTTGLDPRARFVPVQSANGPAMSQEPIDGAGFGRLHVRDTSSGSRATVESEWSLIAFTLAATLLVATVGAAAIGTLRIGGIDFLIAALGAVGIGALHLGKMSRAWRAVLNLRSSWLSREIVAYFAFLVLALATFLSPSPAGILTGAAVVSGFFALYCVDRVYSAISRPSYPRFHSGGAVLTGLYLCGIIANVPPIAACAGLIKLVLYTERQSWRVSPWRFFASVLRLGLGFVMPLALWRAYPDWILPAVVVAEVIDRCEYYLDLNIAAPSSQIAEDLKRATAALGCKIPAPGDHASDPQPPLQAPEI